MSVLVLNEQTERLAIGDVIRSATAGVVEIQGEDGRLVARVVVEPCAQARSPLIEMAEQEIVELRRRARSDRSKDVTTADLLERLHAHNGHESA